MVKSRIHPQLLLLTFLFSCLYLGAQNNCIDLTDLRKPYIHCTYGYFDNPFQYQGIVNGRHTVITQQGLDGNTSNQLSVIPPGEQYSVRLGNDNVGAEAESISVDISIDTNNFDLLILKYAAVMEDPGHSLPEQPRFKFDILDTQNNPIDPGCLSADFIANPSLGWNSSYWGGVLWKDWTNVGVDISSFHGQTIRVRLTTYDCSQSGHYGYAYFLLTCGQKHISIDVCGDVAEYTYSAPSGFNYNWFWFDDPTHSISTNQTVSVPGGGNRSLGCHVSFIENASCGFDLFTTTEYRFPLSGFRVSETSCPQELHFINESLISNDGVTPDGTGNHCPDAFWDFGDGHTSTSFNPVHRYTLPGEYTVTMVAGLNGFECTDTTYLDVLIPENTKIDTLVCDSYIWNGIPYTESGSYSHNYSTSSGCDSLVILNLTVVHEITTSFNSLGCDSIFWNGIKYDESGSFTQNLFTTFGCDSIVTMNLDMNYTPDFVIQGNHYPIGGTELEWTQYTYNIEFLEPRCKYDWVEWSVNCPTMFVFPSEDGMTCDLRIFSHLQPTDSVPLHAVVHNRCGTRDYTVWIHTTYHDVEENMEGVVDFSVFPNPGHGLLHLNMSGLEGEVCLELYSDQGLLVDKWMHVNGSNKETLLYDASGLNDGLYFLRVCHNTYSLTIKCLIRR